METNTAEKPQPTNLKYRYERKIPARLPSLGVARSYIHHHPAHFKEIYHPRQVNNIYLDTSDLKLFKWNKMGTGERKKIRIRWYGEPRGHIQNPTLEFKLKNNTVGTKRLFPLSNFTFNDNLNLRDFHSLLDNSSLPPAVVDECRGLRPSLFNSYHRAYYITPGKEFRLTLDSEMQYQPLQHHFNTRHQTYNDRGMFIFEVKYDLEFDPDAGKVTNAFPFRVDKNSKYVNGIDQIYRLLPT